MDKHSKIYVAGHGGLVGSALVRCLTENGYKNIVVRTSKGLDLRDPEQVEKFFKHEKPEYIFDSAAKVGGIIANSLFPADFIYDNLQIQNNLIHMSYLYGVKKMLFLGSSCIYPKLCPQPIKEEYLLTSELEPSNEWYALAKIAGIKMSQAYRKQYETNIISVMPTNLYGKYDNFNPVTSHVLPAMMRRLHEAKVENISEVSMWGTGHPKREFMHVDDLAKACLFLMKNYDSGDVINVGVGEDLSIKELAELVKDVVEYPGDIKWDVSKPDGTPRKLLDVSKLTSLGWKATIPLEEGIKDTYEWFKKIYG